MRIFLLCSIKNELTELKNNMLNKDVGKDYNYCIWLLLIANKLWIPELRSGPTFYCLLIFSQKKMPAQVCDPLKLLIIEKWAEIYLVCEKLPPHLDPSIVKAIFGVFYLLNVKIWLVKVSVP